MPPCGLLEGVPGLQDFGLRPGLGDNFQADRQPGVGESARHGKGRQAGQVEGGGETGQAAGLFDGIRPLDQRGWDGGSGQQQKVIIAEKALETAAHFGLGAAVQDVIGG